MNAMFRQFLGRTLCLVGALLLMASIALYAISQTYTAALMLCLAGGATIGAGVFAHFMDLRFRTASHGRTRRKFAEDEEEPDDDHAEP